MPVWQAVVYGVVQGLAEFLPISSSAHLTLLPWMCGWEDPGLAFDVALHWGTLAAVLAAFLKDRIPPHRAGLPGLGPEADSRLFRRPRTLFPPAPGSGQALGQMGVATLRAPS